MLKYEAVVICSCKGCECDVSKKALQSQQRRRIIQFLMKLDGKYQQTRSSILIMKDLPTVSEAYRILIQEQTHQEISKITHTIEQDTSMACRVEKRKNYDNKYKKNEKYASGSKKSNTTLFCENCKIHGHTIDRCWKVHGYPQGFKNNSWKKDGTHISKANGVSSDAIVQGQSLDQNNSKNNSEARLTTEQVNQGLSLLNKQQHLGNEQSGTVNSAHFAGAFCLFLKVQVFGF